MFSFQVLVVILLNRCVSSNHDMLPKDVQPCATRSWERVLLDRDEQQLNCSSLPIDIQTSLALHLTFCHLNATGIDPESLCLLSSPSFTLNDCLKNLTTNSFAYLTYTNFLPHIQSICYAVESQRWHSRTRNTILQINTHSNQIETEAKNLLLEQDRLKTSLDQALLVHEHAVDDALHIDRFLQVAQTDVDELRGDLFVKDKAQIELIYQILETLFNIQSSLFADAFGLSSYFFYAASLICIHVLTLPERTNDAKFWLILLWFGLIGLERYTLFLSSYSHILLYDILWRFRQLWFLVSCLTWAYHAVRHRNYSRENQRLIDEIDRKHKKLETAARKCLKVINQLEKTYDSVSDDSSAAHDTSASSSPLTDDEHA